MNAQKENLMEELANRDFIFVEETDVVVYEKETREGSETVTIFGREDNALHERWNQNNVLISSTNYNTSRPAEMVQLLNSCH